MDVRAVINATNVNICQTKGVYDAAKRNVKFRFEVASSIDKFMCGDWGDVCIEDSVANDEALINRCAALDSHAAAAGDIAPDIQITTIVHGDGAVGLHLNEARGAERSTVAH